MSETTSSREALRILRAELEKTLKLRKVELAIAEALLAQSVHMCTGCDAQIASIKQLQCQIDKELGMDIEYDDAPW